VQKKQIVIATTNRGKFLEIEHVLQSLKVPLLSLDYFPGIPEVPEEGNTFEEIARHKALLYNRQLGLPVLAEDSGLLISALDGYPGIISARIAKADTDRIRIILEKLSGKNERSAYYHCSMVFVSPPEMIEATGRCDGIIVPHPRGTSGFGYDPIFQPLESDKTFGEMDSQEKENYSHRGRALRRILPFLKEWISRNP
jgi:XTP/dITP diphosphohydrolase